MNVLNSNTHGIDIVALNIISVLLFASHKYAHNDLLVTQTILKIITILIHVRESSTRMRRFTIGADYIICSCDCYFCLQITDTCATICY